MELKASELRIGNLVQSSPIHENKLKRIKHIHTQHEQEVVFYEGDHIGDFIKDISGITLSAQLLEKCGFWMTFYKTLRLSLINGNAIEFNCESAECYLVFDDTKKTTLEQVKYLHQIQNLYFALLGKELAITL